MDFTYHRWVAAVFVIVCIATQHQGVSAQHLIAYFSQHGLHGEIEFRQLNSTTVEIAANVETTLQYPEQAWNWGVHKFPVDYTEIDPDVRCDLKKLGDKVLSLNDGDEYFILPGNETAVWYKQMVLVGEQGIWGKSLVLTDTISNARICATITTLQMWVEHFAEARFNTPIAGSVHFRWLAPDDNSSGDNMIYSDLYHIQELQTENQAVPVTYHNWKIFVTDILNIDHHRSDDNCNFLQLVLDPENSGEGKGIGDLDERLGKIGVAKDALKSAHRVVFHDDKLKLLPSDLTIPHRTLYLVLFDNQHTENFLACTQIRHVKQLVYKTFISTDGIDGEITFTQRSKFDPTFLNFTLKAAGKDNRQVSRKFAEDVSAFRINTLPPVPFKMGQADYCQSTGDIYSPREFTNQPIPPPGFGTQDQYPLGDLSGKLQNRNKNYYHQYLLGKGSSELSGLYWDLFLPLQGLNSIAHRGMAIYTYNRTNAHNITESLWGCSTITQYQMNGIYQKPMILAESLFRYPIVGRVFFRQPAEEPWRDTTVLFEYLIHADGSVVNNTFEHRWAIHSNAPGKDFYDWQNRCASTGNIYNPFNVDRQNRSAEDYCTPHIPNMCKLGDMNTRVGGLTIAGSKRHGLTLSRRLFTDTNLPLSGSHNILGKSIVIYDDFGPKARGDRLACSIITGHYPRKVVAKDWYANGDRLTVSGKVEITQQSEYDISNIEVQLKGLDSNGGYHVHMTPVEANLEFPCEASTLYEHWNPFNVSSKRSPAPTNGTTDQYEMGDLSGKFGTLDGLTRYAGVFNDTSLPLFGLNSIIGRSVVIHKKRRNARWACSTLERGYSPREAREVRGIASFHHPTGFAYGYIRMTQLIHADGSQSDTVLEIKLRHPGRYDRNITMNHNWQIFINSVGVDATVMTTATRCVAGGFVWNPYYTQLADPMNTDLYAQECGPDNPLRCYVGDVGARLGPIHLGKERVLLTDSNIPLDGPVSAIGRSIVLFGPEFSNERYACANIEPDHNIIKYINLEKPPRFVVAQFLEELRSVMGIPEWMLDVDARKTRELHRGACIQMIIHFKGPIAHRLESDMSTLITAGRLQSPSLYIPGYHNSKRKTTLSYRTCGVHDINEKTVKLNRGLFSSSNGLKPKLLPLILSLCFFTFNVHIYI